MVARTWKRGSGSEIDETNIICFKKREKLQQKNDFQIDFVDIGLENVAVAAARVTDIPSRPNKKRCQKRPCL